MATASLASISKDHSSDLHESIVYNSSQHKHISIFLFCFYTDHIQQFIDTYTICYIGKREREEGQLESVPQELYNKIDNCQKQCNLIEISFEAVVSLEILHHQQHYLSLQIRGLC